MALFILLAAATLVPSVLLVTYFHRRDVYREPPAVLWRAFGWGILIIFPVCLLALPLDLLAAQLGHPLAYGFASAFLSAAIPEELCKFAVLFFWAARHIQFDEPMDGIVYGATASLGFATLENVLYVSDGGLPVAIVRAFLAVPGHAFLGAIMGYYIGRAKFTDGDPKPLLVRALVFPILLHGLYDAPLLAGDSSGVASDPGCLVLALLPMVLAIVVGEAVWALRLVRRVRAEQLAAGCPPPPPEPVAAAAVVVPAPGTVAATPPASEPGRPPWGGPGGRPTSRRPSRWASWLLVLFGGLIACGGALVTLGLLLTLAEGGSSSEGRLYDLIAGVVLGLLPLAAGTFGFFWGIRRLNRNR